MSIKRFGWLGTFAAVVAVVLGMSLLSGSTPASATGSGPTISAHASTNLVALGGGFDLTLSTTTVPTDAYKGYNASVVYSAFSLGGALTANSAADLSVPGLWPADFPPPPSLANNFAGALTPPLLGAIAAATSLPAAPTVGIGPMVKFHFTANTLGTTALHMVTQAEAGAGANSFSTYTINGADSTRQSNVFACADAPFCGPIVIAAPNALAAPYVAGSGVMTLAAAPVGVPPAGGVVLINGVGYWYGSQVGTALSLVAGGVCGYGVDTNQPAAAPVLFIYGGGATPAAAQCSQPWDVIVSVIQQTPVITMTKTASAASIVAGQPIDFQLTVANGLSPATTATNITVSDTLDPAAFPGGANVSFVGSTFTSCGVALQVITCTAASLAPGASATVTVHLAATVATAGGFSYTNKACANAANNPPPGGTVLPSTQSCSSTNVQLIPPAVAWSKSPTVGNIFITDGTQTFTFDEIMTNQGDVKGLGAFSFDIHWDVTQYQQPVIDLNPAVVLFASAGRNLACTITIPGNGITHVACASTGVFGVGPQWVGPKVMAHVTLTLQAFVMQSIRPNKENGDVSWVKDDQVTVTNTCGQPLNDETIQPLPGQPECQGNLLQGVGPGGVLTGNPNGGESVQTWRRLEGDITKDCKVDVSDMQLEASKFGMSVGSLLYNVFYDVNSPLQHGDGEIDINDIQFVYGRSGSTCANPIPPQPPATLP